ncbi:hypothetical protein NKG05_10755 [Oerskovia sp. M15]
MREALVDQIRTPRRWVGRLRRTAVARAIQGSNSIEGYNVELDDADAAVEGTNRSAPTFRPSGRSRATAKPSGSSSRPPETRTSRSMPQSCGPCTTC